MNMDEQCSHCCFNYKQLHYCYRCLKFYCTMHYNATPLFHNTDACKNTSNTLHNLPYCYECRANQEIEQLRVRIEKL